MHWVISDGTVYGKQYYTIMPPMFESDWMAMEVWCYQRFGPTGNLWKERKNLAPEPNQRWYASNSKFWFVDEKDLNWFVLRWVE